MSVPLHLRRDAIGPLSPGRELEWRREYGEAITEFMDTPTDFEVSYEDGELCCIPLPPSFREARDQVDEDRRNDPWYVPDEPRRQLARYLEELEVRRVRGGRCVTRWLGHVPEETPFDIEEEVVATVLAALDAYRSRSELLGTLLVNDLEPDQDDLDAADAAEDDRHPPDALVAVHALTAAPSAPPFALIG